MIFNNISMDANKICSIEYNQAMRLKMQLNRKQDDQGLMPFDSSKHIFIPPCAAYSISYMHAILRFIESCPEKFENSYIDLFDYVGCKKYQGLVHFYWDDPYGAMYCYIPDHNKVIIVGDGMQAKESRIEIPTSIGEDRNKIHFASARDGIITPKYDEATIQKISDIFTELKQVLVK